MKRTLASILAFLGLIAPVSACPIVGASSYGGASYGASFAYQAPAVAFAAPVCYAPAVQQSYTYQAVTSYVPTVQAVTSYVAVPTYQQQAVQVQQSYAPAPCVPAPAATMPYAPVQQQTEESYQESAAQQVQQGAVVQQYQQQQEAVCPPEIVQQIVQSNYSLPQAVQYMQQNYGMGAGQAVQLLRSHGHSGALAFRGDAETLVVADRLANGVEVGGRRGFGAEGAKTKVKVKRKKKKVRA